MTSICSNYQQHFQLTNGNIMLLHQQQQQLQQQLLQQHQHHQQQQQQQLIAPKQPLGNSQLQNMQQTNGAASRSGTGVGPMLAKKKYTNSSSNFASLPYGGAEQQMPSVARRNARERNRVKQVNNGFVNLRQHLPQTVINSLSNGGRGASKKLSKVDTLRIAVEYIRGLQDMLDDDGQPRAQLIFSSTDECSNDSYNDDYNDSLDSPPRTQSHTAAYHHNHHSYHSASPTPSYSDASELSASYVKQELPEQEKQQQKQQAEQQQQFKFESFDSFSDEQPDDEELLDYISSWQEQ